VWQVHGGEQGRVAVADRRRRAVAFRRRRAAAADHRHRAVAVRRRCVSTVARVLLPAIVRRRRATSAHHRRRDVFGRRCRVAVAVGDDRLRRRVGQRRRRIVGVSWPPGAKSVVGAGGVPLTRRDGLPPQTAATGTAGAADTGASGQTADGARVAVRGAPLMAPPHSKQQLRRRRTMPGRPRSACRPPKQPPSRRRPPHTKMAGGSAAPAPQPTKTGIVVGYATAEAEKDAGRPSFRRCRGACCGWRGGLRRPTTSPRRPSPRGRWQPMTTTSRRGRGPTPTRRPPPPVSFPPRDGPSRSSARVTGTVSRAAFCPLPVAYRGCRRPPGSTSTTSWSSSTTLPPKTSLPAATAAPPPARLRRRAPSPSSDASPTPPNEAVVGVAEQHEMGAARGGAVGGGARAEGGGRIGRGCRSGNVGVAARKRAAATVCAVSGSGDKRKNIWRRWGPKENAERSRHSCERLHRADPDTGCSEKAGI